MKRGEWNRREGCRRLGGGGEVEEEDTIAHIIIIVRAYHSTLTGIAAVIIATAPSCQGHLVRDAACLSVQHVHHYSGQRLFYLKVGER